MFHQVLASIIILTLSLEIVHLSLLTNPELKKAKDSLLTSLCSGVADNDQKSKYW